MKYKIKKLNMKRNKKKKNKLKFLIKIKMNN